MKPWRRAQRQTAKDTGGRETPGSGNQWHSPGDVQSTRWLIENKDTRKETYQLAAGIWTKIVDEARFASQEPAIVVSFRGQPEVAIIRQVHGRPEWASLPANQTIDPIKLRNIWYGGEKLTVARITMAGDTLIALPYHEFLEL